MSKDKTELFALGANIGDLYTDVSIGIEHETGTYEVSVKALRDKDDPESVAYSFTRRMPHAGLANLFLMGMISIQAAELEDWINDIRPEEPEGDSPVGSDDEEESE